MKRLMLISASMMIAAGAFAQSASGSDNSLFRFDNSSTPKEITRLGTAPEYPFIRNLKTPNQVYNAIKKRQDENAPGMDHLNNMLMQIGFANGIQDLSASNITAANVAPGTEGNMGSRGYTSSYSKLSGDPSEFKAWKITSDNGGYMYLMAKCGNAFYPRTARTTACVTAPVNFTGDMKQVTLTDSGQKVTTTTQEYVYYHLRHHKRHDVAHSNPEIPDAFPSRPLLLRKDNDVEVMPVTYNITANPGDNMVSVCPDSTLNIAANINVEKTSSYAGYYPDKNKKEYKEVTKHKYKKIARKLRKEEKKERKIAHMSGIKANVYS